jgi:hypothetical protein
VTPERRRRLLIAAAVLGAVAAALLLRRNQADVVDGGSSGSVGPLFDPSTALDPLTPDAASTVAVTPVAPGQTVAITPPGGDTTVVTAPIPAPQPPAAAPKIEWNGRYFTAAQLNAFKAYWQDYQRKHKRPATEKAWQSWIGSHPRYRAFFNVASLPAAPSSSTTKPAAPSPSSSQLVKAAIVGAGGIATRAPVLVHPVAPTAPLAPAPGPSAAASAASRPPTSSIGIASSLSLVRPPKTRRNKRRHATRVPVR